MGQKTIEVAAGLIFRAGELLITQRHQDSHLGGLWEFPGGKREPGETLEACLRREIREELDIEIHVGKLFMAVKHAYSHFRITLHCFDCTHKSGRVRKLGVADFRWVLRGELSDFAFPKADREILKKLAPATVGGSERS